MPKRKVLLDHDGGVDDLLSLLLLTQIPEVDLIGVCITPADCFLEGATPSTLKILKITGREEVPVARGTVRAVHPFPREWRAHPMMVNALPQMLLTEEDPAQVSPLPAHEFLAGKLRSAATPVSVLITGPCSNLVKALEGEPGLKTKVAEVIWMGGAVDVGGNVATWHHNTTAEWNAFWDPPATKALFGLDLPIRLISLDVTNSVPVSLDFLKRLARQAHHPLSNLAAQFWATTINTIPGYEYTYFMWDVLATSYLGIPQAFSFERMELDVGTQSPNAGQTFRAPDSGHWVEVAKMVDKEIFYQYILGLLAN